MTATRVATIPAEHPYLDAVVPDRVRIASPGRWAPSPLLDVHRLRAEAPGIDVVHVHFGYDHLSPVAMQQWVRAVHALGLRLVVTVHDLRNPHHDTAERHEHHLSTLLRGADEVITLTDPAASRIRAMSGRAAIVLPHPGLVTPLPGIASTSGLVGLHLKSLRRNVAEPLRLVRTIAACRGTLQVNVHPGPLVADLERLSEDVPFSLYVHERYNDLELVRYLQGLHASVLPYRFGTHSGWLEACRDVGTRVVVPSCGYYAAQWVDAVVYRNDERCGLDEHSLTEAVNQALSDAPPVPADPHWRVRQREELRAAHQAVYRFVTGLRKPA